MEKYEILEHKADLKIRVFGATKEELFLNALLGMEESLKPQLVAGSRYQALSREIKIKSIDLPALLVDFLNEALYLIQTNKEFYGDIKFKKLTDPSINSGQAELEGELFGRKVERFGEDIKAATYHNLELEKKPARNAFGPPDTLTRVMRAGIADAGGDDGTWEALILFDI